MQKFFSLTDIGATDAIPIDADKQFTFAISGNGTVQAEVQLTDDPNAVWYVAQVCVSGTIYSTVSGARAFRFNQTASSGATIAEVSGAKL